MSDEKFMRRALELALRGTGSVSPNPRVGAVIVRDNNIIAEGWHKRFGEAHAEPDAIAAAGSKDLRGSTIYVNLEPCSHYGKTPPCAPLIVEKGFSRVVIGMLDPNPLVAGRGAEALREAGIDVKVGVLEKTARHVNRFFIKNIEQGKPFVAIKVAQSADGTIALANGESKYITGEESLNRAHALRAEFDAVLTGKGTVAKDNPLFTVRRLSGRNPKRVILDSNLSLPLSAKVFTEGDRHTTIVCCKPGADKSRKADNLRLAGINIFPVQLNEDNRIDLEAALKALYVEFSIGSILIEAGSNINSNILKIGAADEIHFFVAPKIMGGGRQPFEQLSLRSLSDAIKLELQYAGESGEDLHVIYNLVKQ
ncbi:MAG: bifunctional diaminohydroxyphosphoribosylaminopyrimidine deaminase/5-amino-6-(5-phosphoribosylamino)uracil reductase RibD [Chloroflexota bacterium]